MLINVHKDEDQFRFANCLIPSRYRDVEAYEEEMDDLGKQLDEETLKAILPSGHAFVCFDSIKSMRIVLDHYSITPMKYVRLLCI
jgi:hypothetical protein